MRGAMDGDVAAERQLNAIKDLLKVLPRSRGFRVSVDGSVSVYPAGGPNLPAGARRGRMRAV